MELQQPDRSLRLLQKTIRYGLAVLFVGTSAAEGRATMCPQPVAASADRCDSGRNCLDREKLAAIGRRTLSTAFVRVGPDGVLTVDLDDGMSIMLRNVAIGPRRFCGERLTWVGAARRYCGDYAKIAAARPGPSQPDPAAVDEDAGVAKPLNRPKR